MSLLLVTAIMFGMMGGWLLTSRDEERFTLGFVMFVSGVLFALMTYVIRVQS